jgi:hypothetical protein
LVGVVDMLGHVWLGQSSIRTKHHHAGIERWRRLFGEYVIKSIV